MTGEMSAEVDFAESCRLKRCADLFNDLVCTRRVQFGSERITDEVSCQTDATADDGVRFFADCIIPCHNQFPSFSF